MPVRIVSKQNEKSAKTMISSKNHEIRNKPSLNDVIEANPNPKAEFKKPTEKKLGIKKAMTPKKQNIKKKAKKKLRVKKTIGQRIKKFFLWLFITLFVLGIIGAGATGWFIKQAIDKIPEYDIEEIFSLKDKSIIYDINGKEVARIGGNNRESITFEDLPQVFIDAMVSIEDLKFFVHSGVDYNRFGKAILDVFLTGGFDGSGASTLTMQASKNAITQPGLNESTLMKIERKLQDIYLSTFVIEKNYTKEEIFMYYVNSNFLGGNAWGVQAAAENYFDKDVQDLNLAEAAMIAGLFQAPGGLDPYENGPEGAQERRDIVLEMMVRHGYISQETCDATKKIQLESYLTGPKNNSDQYVDYINAVVEEVIEKTGKDPYDTPMRIYTYMDKDLQDYLISIKNGEHPDVEYPDEALNLGLVMLDTKTAQIRGVINGRNTVTKGINYATGVQTHPGSSAKPLFDYAPCFEQGICYSDSQYILDDYYTYKNGKPVYNWDRTYKGLITLGDALAASRNTPALKIFHQLDNKKVADFVEGLGITPQFEEKNGRYLFESHAIGSFEDGASPLELAAAYAAFANDGIYIEPTALKSVTMTDTNEFLEFEQESHRAMSSETAYLINKMLEQSVYSSAGLYRSMNKRGIRNAVKSGTSNWDVEYADDLGTDVISKDLFFINYNPHYTIGYWMGYGELTQEHVDNGWLLTTDRKRFRMDIVHAVYKGGHIPADYATLKYSTRNIIEKEFEVGTLPLKLPSKNTPGQLRRTGFFIKGKEPTEVSDRFLLPSVPGSINATVNSSNGSIALTWDKQVLPRTQNYTLLEEMFKGDYDPHYFKHMMNYTEVNNSLFGELGYFVELLDAEGNVLKTLDFVHASSTGYIVSADEYADVITTGDIQFRVTYRYEKSAGEENAISIVGATLNTGLISVDLDSKKHLISTSEKDSSGGALYRYIEEGSDFTLPTVSIFEPQPYPGQEDAETTDQYISVKTASNLILGPSQPRYVDGEEVILTFDDPSIVKVRVNNKNISTGYAFEPTKGNTYTVEVTREVPNTVDNDDDDSTPIEPATVEETYTFDLVFLAEDPVNSYIPEMVLVADEKITKTIYYVSNGEMELVTSIDVEKVGNYDVYYSYTNDNGFLVNEVRHFKVHASSQRLLQEQLKAEKQAREDR